MLASDSMVCSIYLYGDKISGWTEDEIWTDKESFFAAPGLISYPSPTLFRFFFKFKLRI